MPSDNTSAPYVCEICGQTATTKGNLIQHIFLHTTLKPFVCDVCDESFATKTNLNGHKLLHTEERNYECETCGRSFYGNSDLTKHKLLHTQERKYICGICNKRFVNNQCLKTHMRSKLTHSVWCKICKERFPDQKAYKRHILTPCKKKTFACDICNKILASQASHRIHVLKHDKKQKKYFCDVCTRGFSHQSLLKRHLNYSHKKKNYCYECSMCKKGFNRKFDLNVHLERHVGLKNYKCEKCDKAFISKQNMKQHFSETHLKKKRHKCDECEKFFTRATSLKRHYRVHTQEMPYSCDVCLENFRTKLLLMIHKERYHDTVISEEKANFACKVCGETLICESSLNHHYFKKHKKYHSEMENKAFSDKNLIPSLVSTTSTVEKMLNTKLYSCGECDKKYTIKRLLIAHYQGKHYKSHPYICQVCPDIFSTEDSFKEHKLIHSDVGHRSRKNAPTKNALDGSKCIKRPQPFSCNICSRGFSRSFNLYVHFKYKHLESHPYICKMCPDHFIDKETYVEHNLIHSNKGIEETKTYKCMQSSNSVEPEKKVSHTNKVYNTRNRCSAEKKLGENSSIKDQRAEKESSDDDIYHVVRRNKRQKCLFADKTVKETSKNQKKIKSLISSKFKTSEKSNMKSIKHYFGRNMPKRYLDSEKSQTKDISGFTGEDISHNTSDSQIKMVDDCSNTEKHIQNNGCNMQDSLIFQSTNEHEKQQIIISNEVRNDKSIRCDVQFSIKKQLEEDNSSGGNHEKINDAQLKDQVMNSSLSGKSTEIISYQIDTVTVPVCIVCHKSFISLNICKSQKESKLCTMCYKSGCNRPFNDSSNNYKLSGLPEKSTFKRSLTDMYNIIKKNCESPVNK